MTWYALGLFVGHAFAIFVEIHDSRFGNAYSMNSHGCTVYQHILSLYQLSIHILVQSITFAFIKATNIQWVS